MNEKMELDTYLRIVTGADWLSRCEDSISFGLHYIGTDWYEQGMKEFCYRLHTHNIASINTICNRYCKPKDRDRFFQLLDAASKAFVAEYPIIYPEQLLKTIEYIDSQCMYSPGWKETIEAKRLGVLHRDISMYIIGRLDRYINALWG